MTRKDVQALLSLETRAERRTWLEHHRSTPRDDFAQALYAEADRRKREAPTNALHISEIAAEAAAVWQEPTLRALARHVAAEARRLMGEHRAALQHYAEAAGIYRAQGLEADAARVSVGRLDALMYLGRYDEALELADRIGETLREAGRQLDLGKVLTNCGNIYTRLDRHQEARACYEEARALFTELGEELRRAMVDVNDAIQLIELDRYAEAEATLQAARETFAAEGMDNLTAIADHNIGYLYFAQGEYQQALATFARARAIFEEQQSQVDVAYVDLYRSDIYLALNLWQEALTWGRTARTIFDATGMTWEMARLWLNEAAALAHDDAASGAPDTALERAYAIFEAEQNAVWLANTDLYRAAFARRRQDLPAARHFAGRARAAFAAAGVPSRVAQCEAELGKIALRSDDVAAAERHFAAGLEALGEADLPAVAYACHFGLGRAAQRRGDDGAALAHHRRAVEDIERLQAAIGAEDYKIAFLSDKLQVYESLVLLCFEQDTPEAMQEAFETVERAKSRALLDALARGESPPLESTPTEATLLAELERLKRELNWYYNRLNEPQPDSDKRSARRVAELTEAVTLREQALSRLIHRWRAPDLATAPRNPIWTVTPEQIQAALPPQTTLVEFFTADDQILVFGISPTEMWSHRLPASLPEIATLLRQFYFQINKFSYGAGYRERHAAMLQRGTDESLRQLYAALWAPLAERLETEAAIVVPHDSLHYVPFHALFDGERYLIEEQTLSYAPSATILRRVLAGSRPGRTSAEPPGPPFILGVADPTIPFAEEEVRAIAELFPGADVRFGERATTDSLMAQNARPAFLHLSTHATFRADNPLFSALKLSNGWLNVNDIYGMPVAAPLVTLSACETGRSQIMAGDELVGLCRGFFSAGARSLVVSLWMVDDSSTARLMTHFYRRLQSGEPVNRALRMAQLTIKERWPHPYYWAPFVLTGNVHTQLTSHAMH